MAKLAKIDLSEDRLLDLADEKIGNHNYIEGLKLLNKNAGIRGSCGEAYMIYAEAFDDMDLYEKSVNCWFMFLDCADEDTCAEDLAECYEGLAVNYMNLGEERFSAYYYNKLLVEAPKDMLLPQFEREEILNDFMSLQEENPLKFVYPPESADCTEIFKTGFEHMKNGDYDEAESEFNKVADGNPKYISARNYIAMCKIITDRTDEAEQECMDILKRRPDDVQALTTLSAVMTEKGDYGRAKEFAEKLLKLDVSEPDEIYKIATVCCENKMHAEAYETFSKLPEEFAYDLTVLFFKAVSAFNCGRDAECLKAFDTAVTVYPEAVTANYYYRLVREMMKSGRREELSYFYRLPSELRESTLKVLAASARLSASSAKKLSDTVDLTACVRWCFDGAEPRGGDLQALACRVAVRAGLDGLVREFLLNAFLSDKLKLVILCGLAERNEENSFGLVVCNVFRRVRTQSLNLGGRKRKTFIRAYAKLFSDFAIIDETIPEKFALTTEKLYLKLETEGRLDEVKSEGVLCAAVYISSGVKAAEIKEDDLCEFFGAKKAQVYKLLNGAKE